MLSLYHYDDFNNNNNNRNFFINTSLKASSGGNYGDNNGKKPKKGNTVNNDDDEWLEENDSIYIRSNNDNLPSINNNVYITLEQTLGELITVSAIDTLSYYMIEFHDDDTQRWMMSFKNYKLKGFNKNDLLWQTYLEEMIKLDTQYFKVYLDPPRVASRLKNNQLKDKNLKVMYIDEIQPRKIAHRLITVREDVANEVIMDLGSIHLENKEAVKFANNWITHGKEYAENHRGLTRGASDGGSTPLRGKTFKDISLLITNLSLDILRADLMKRKEKGSIDFIDALLEKIYRYSDGLDQINTMLVESSAPQSFLEELCYMGLTQGVGGGTIGAAERSPSTTVNTMGTARTGTASTGAVTGVTNFLKLSQQLLLTREALTVASMKILNEQNKELRYYFKLIKDYGGFKPFDLTGGRKVVRIVDMDEEEKKEKEKLFDTMMMTTSNEAKAVETDVDGNGGGGDVKIDRSSSSSVDKDNEINISTTTIVEDKEGTESSSSVDKDEEYSLFSQEPSTGPMMM